MNRVAEGLRTLRTSLLEQKSGPAGRKVVEVVLEVKVVDVVVEMVDAVVEVVDVVVEMVDAVVEAVELVVVELVVVDSWQEIVSLAVALYEPVKLEPPPPRAPPITKGLK